MVPYRSWTTLSDSSRYINGTVYENTGLVTLLWPMVL